MVAGRVTVSAVGLVDDPPQPLPSSVPTQGAAVAIQARMFVQSLKQNAGTPEAREVVMTAVTRGKESAGWSKWTPSATLTMFVTNPDALEQIEVGREFLLTFEDVTPDTAK